MTDPSGGGYRVLHIAQKLPGGVGAYLAEVLTSQIATLGADRLRICVADSDRFVLPALPQTCWITFPTSRRSVAGLWSFARAARRAILQAQPDVVHLHSTYAGLLRPIIASLPRRLRPKVVYCAHGWAFNMRWSQPKRRLFALVERLLAPMADRIVCISQFEADCAGDRGLPSARMQVIHNGIRSGAGPRPRAGSSCGPLNLLFIGRQDEQKGLDIAEAAMALLLDRAVHLDVIGDSVLGATTRTKTGPPNITYHGWQNREAIWAFIAKADAVVIPSRWEGFGLAAIEAMRQGRPVLASRVDALPEVVSDGVTGLLFPAADPPALAQLIRSLDRETLRELGRNARGDFLARFTGERMNREILELYDAVLDGSGACVHRRRP